MNVHRDNDSPGAFSRVSGCPRHPPVGQCAPFMDTPATTPTRRALANAIRALSMDAVQAANSGHPGAPMGMADIAEVLWRDVLKHNPGNPKWWNRDRFVLSNGHGSMLLYSLLHLTGYPLAIDELKKFRQLGARTAGHPERDLEIGIETTTGPLGPGLRQRGGHGARREIARGAVQPRRRADRRSPHLLLRRRRLPHGRHLARSGVVRRPPEARQAHRVLRRQRHLASTARSPAGSPKTRRSASRPTAGTW